MMHNKIEGLLEVCRAITAEKDREALLTFILDKAIDISSCDAGTIYLLENGSLNFCRMVTRSLSIHQGGNNGPISLPPVPLNENFVCSWVAIHKEMCVFSDVYTDKRFDFSGTKQYDQLTGYRTKSMLVVPMTDDKGSLLGVMQLINALDAEGSVVSFDSDSELLISAIASQAAISIVNMQYAEQVTLLLDSLVGALSEAIDERSHYNADHTRHMVAIAERFLDWIRDNPSFPPFSVEKRREFIMAVWLHDVGKLAVPLEIMDKDSRLSDHIKDIRDRIHIISLLDHIAFLEKRIDKKEYERRNEERIYLEEFIENINRKPFLLPEDTEIIELLSHKFYIDENGKKNPWITETEYECLSIKKGTLTDSERNAMQGHVQITEKILNRVKFPPDYSDVPVWASMHHEFLNGRGYPKHLSNDEIPIETRILTILDIYEALTAKNRPYKKAMLPEQAFLVLESMANEGSIDKNLLKKFYESKSWEAVL